MPIEIDESNYPLVWVRTSGRCSDEEYEAYHDHVVAIMKRARAEGLHFVMINDSRTSEGVTAKQRRDMALFLEEHHDEIVRTSLGLGLIVANALQRGVLTAILWIRPLPVAHRVFTDPEEAKAWAKTQLARARSA